MNDSQTHTEFSFVTARTFLIFIFHNDLYYSATCDVHGAVLAKYQLFITIEKTD